MFWQTIVVLFLANTIEMYPQSPPSSPPRYPMPPVLSSVTGQIVGGEVVPITQIPFQVAILRNNELMCGGTIISPSWILTAAHCAQESLSVYSVRIGSSLWNLNGTKFNVTQIIQHKNYSAVTMANDAALFKLSGNINYSSSARNATLPTLGPNANAIVNVSGWGSTRLNGPSTLTLRTAKVIVNTTAQCTNAYGVGTVHSSQFCAAAWKKDSCQGDSGGPLYSVNNGVTYVYGIVSWGEGCANIKYPGVYTNVSVIRNWILSSTSTPPQ